MTQGNYLQDGRLQTQSSGSSTTGSISSLCSLLEKTKKDLIREISELRYHRPDSVGAGPNLEQILGSVSEVFGMSPHAIIGQSRKAETVVARKAVMYIAYSMGYSMTAIGVWYGFNHTTVKHSIDTFPNDLSKYGEKAFWTAVNAVTKMTGK